MIIPRSVWVSVATVLAISLVVGTVWWLRARSLRDLVVLDAPRETSSTVEPPPRAPSSTSVAEAIKLSDEIFNRPVSFVPAPDLLPGTNIIYPSDGAISPAPLPPESASPAPPRAADQNVQDGDRDGLTNDQELQLGTDPSKSDSDSDELSDGDEVKKFRTDPKKADSDGDGYSDAQEIKNGYNPLGTGTCLTTGCAF